MNSLTALELVSRMDGFLKKLEIERHGSISLPPFSKPDISLFFRTIHVQSLEHDKQIDALHYCFEFLIQMDLVLSQSGFKNGYLYNNKYDKDKSWKSPLFQVRNASISQAEIIMSRVAFEKFINLIHFLEHEKALEVKKSKLNKYFEKLANSNSKFLYFLPTIHKARHFDTKFRTGEVHKKSRIIRGLLLLSSPSSEEANFSYKLTNVLMGLWRPLIDILSNKKPHYMQGSQEDFDFLNALLEDEDKIPSFIERFRDKLKT